MKIFYGILVVFFATPLLAKTPFTKKSKEETKKMLTPEAYRVTQEGETETPFHNKYWNHHEEGIYVDIASGEPLFSSTDKYDSGTGWPSFHKPIQKGFLESKKDNSMFAERTEVLSKVQGSHLGHVFNDGPGPTGERYCINSGALRFVPKGKLVEEHYEEYLYLFEKKKKD